jgi:hypothetical protein
MSKTETPKPQGIAFGVARCENGTYQVIRVRFRGKQVLDWEVVRNDLTRADVRSAFHRPVAEFFWDDFDSKL